MPKKSNRGTEVSPYHYILQCLGGKRKMTLLHGIRTFGKIRFDQALKALPISEKASPQQLKELIDNGLIRSISYGVIPPRVEYRLTEAGNELIPALDIFYTWATRQTTDKGISIDTDNFVVYLSEKYVDSLREYIKKGNLFQAAQGKRNAKNE